MSKDEASKDIVNKYASQYFQRSTISSLSRLRDGNSEFKEAFEKALELMIKKQKEQWNSTVTEQEYYWSYWNNPKNNVRTFDTHTNTTSDRDNVADDLDEDGNVIYY